MRNKCGDVGREGTCEYENETGHYYNNGYTTDRKQELIVKTVLNEK